jgi:hypothetical protein
MKPFYEAELRTWTLTKPLTWVVTKPFMLDLLSHIKVELQDQEHESWWNPFVSSIVNKPFYDVSREQTLYEARNV